MVKYGPWLLLPLIGAAAILAFLFLHDRGGESLTDDRGLPGTPVAPEKDAQAREILFQNDAVKGILAGREEGHDYWLKIGYVYEHREAKNTGEKPIAMVNIFFDPPISWTGEVPAKSDPCQGHYQDDWLDPHDPCRNQLPQFGTDYREFSQAQGIAVEVDLRRGQVVLVFEVPVTPDEIKDAQKGYAP